MEISDEGLFLEALLPISFKLIHVFPEESQLALINEANEVFLKASTSMSHRESIEIDEHDEISVELRRQDLKISLLIDMMGELLLQQKQIPDAIKVKLNASGLFCSEYDIPANVGDKVEIRVFITPSIPKPLKLYGEVIAKQNDSGTEFKFAGINQSVRDGLEKIIFRQHRRTIAQRLTSPSDQG